MIVKITPGHISQICSMVRDTFAEEHQKVNGDIPDTFTGLGEFFYGQLMSIEDQQKVIDLFPKEMKPETINRVCLKIKGTEDTPNRWVPAVYVNINQGLAFSVPITRTDLPGIKSLIIGCAGLVEVTLAEDTTAFPPAIRDFVTKVASISAQHVAVDKRIETEVGNMRRFLKDHKTLQSAIAAMPALKFYLNWFIQQELEAPEPNKKPRQPRKCVEKQPYDISGLVVKSAAARLNL